MDEGQKERHGKRADEKELMKSMIDTHYDKFKNIMS
jgi:hypothetical protein